MDDNGGVVQANRLAQAVWIVTLLLAVVVVFVIVGLSVRENIMRPPKVGHEHVHVEGQPKVPTREAKAPPGVEAVKPDEMALSTEPGHEGHAH